MSKTRVWVFGAIAAMLVVIVGGWTLGISPVFAQVSSTSSQLTTSQASARSSQVQLATLKGQFKNISKLKKKLNALRLSVPEDQAASLFLAEISIAGAATGVSLQTVTIASATLYTSATATTAPAGAAATTSTATPTPAAGTTATVTPATTTTTPSGLILIPVVITVKGSLEATREFADLMQTGPRLLVASSLSVAIDGSVATTTVTGTIFSQPGTSDAPKSTSTGGGISTATPTPSATPTPTTTPTASTSTSTTTKTGGTPPSTAPVTPPVTPSPTDTPPASP